MPSATFEQRLKRLTAEAEPRPAPAPKLGPSWPRSRPSQPDRSALQRFDDGLARIPAAGLRPERMMWLRLLARAGLPVAPWPYWSAMSLLAVFTLFPILFFGGMLRLIDVIDVANKIDLHSRPIDALRWFGLPGIVTATLLLAPLAVLRQRRLARRANLPDWAQV
jgi:hypothetical protein